MGVEDRDILILAAVPHSDLSDAFDCSSQPYLFTGLSKQELATTAPGR
jgi:hypothetical protein